MRILFPLLFDPKLRAFETAAHERRRGGARPPFSRRSAAGLAAV